MTTRADRKLAELLLYLADRLEEEPAAGATKLNKLAFFADFAHVRTTGQPITGADYQRLPHGPAPRRLVPVRDRLIAKGDAELVDVTHLGYVQQRLVARRPADLSVFTEEERATIDEVIERLGDRTGTELSDLSHREPAWELVKEGDLIPYEAAFLRSGPPSPQARRHAAELAKRHRQS